MSADEVYGRSPMLEGMGKLPPLPTVGHPLNLYDYLRAGHVKRWHVVNTAGTQNIAEHSFLVTLIAIELYHAVGGDDASDLMPGYQGDLNQLIMGALFHDMAEVRTGDLPTPGKKLIESVHPGLFDTIEEDLLPEIPYLGGRLPLALWQYISMADLIEAAHWIADHAIGSHAELVAARIRLRLEKLVAEHTSSSGKDWYAPVNRVLMALGDPPIHRETEVRAL
jgi:5'-deoxynucleotidase YfbR-like HD superfamily hydrolase